MKRKEFLKTSSALVAGSLLAPMVSCNQTARAARTNWAGNYTYQAEKLHEPSSVEELQSLVGKLDKQKAVGSRHCFNNIADSPLNQLSTRKLNKLVKLDEVARAVTVEGGILYGELAPQLHERGFALHNLASLPHISVVGGCATATHGSGVNNTNMAGKVVAIELVTPNGELVSMDRQHPDFYGSVVSLGALGIVSRITLEVEPTFQVRQDLFQNLPLQSVKDHFDAIMSAGYSVSLFTDWQNQEISQVWIKRRTDQPLEELGNDFYGATAATRNLHPITEMSPENCTQQMGEAGPWYERLPHFKMGFTPSSGDELQSEFFVGRENAVDALLALEAMKNTIYPQLMISEIRAVAADQHWMSTCYQRDGIAFHFTWKPNWPEVRKILPRIEAELSPYAARPHWGKLFTMKPEVLHSRYPKIDDFLALTSQYDPEGKFRNAYLDLNIYRTSV